MTDLLRSAPRSGPGWIRTISGPAEYDYTPGYYAVFLYDPDGIKLELLNRPTYWEWLRSSSA